MAELLRRYPHSRNLPITASCKFPRSCLTTIQEQEPVLLVPEQCVNPQNSTHSKGEGCVLFTSRIGYLDSRL